MTPTPGIIRRVFTGLPRLDSSSILCRPNIFFQELNDSCVRNIMKSIISRLGRRAVLTTVAIIFGPLLPAQIPAQSMEHPEATIWGRIVQGVQLSITMTNRDFPVGSSADVASVTRNSSTNVIVVDIFAPTIVFDLDLNEQRGKSYHVTTPMAI